MSTHLAIAKLSQKGAAPVAATLPDFTWIPKKCAAPLEISWLGPWTMSTTQTASLNPSTALIATLSSQKGATSPCLLLPP